jgi:hypothetical protein
MRVAAWGYFFFVVFFAFLAGAFLVAMCLITFLSGEMMNPCGCREPSGGAGRGAGK